MVAHRILASYGQHWRCTVPKTSKVEERKADAEAL
jgi:hypothetical protein